MDISFEFFQLNFNARRFYFFSIKFLFIQNIYLFLRIKKLPQFHRVYLKSLSFFLSSANQCFSMEFKVLLNLTYYSHCHNVIRDSIYNNVHPFPILKPIKELSFSDVI